MSEMILSIDAPEGTYQLSCLVPNPNNAEPQAALSVEKFANADGKTVNLNAIPKTTRHLVVSAISEGTYDPDDDSGVADFYRVLALPLPGSHYAKEGMGVAIVLQNTPDIVKRVYLGSPANETAQEAHLVLNPPPDEPENPCSVCGADNDSDSKFCASCGTKLEAASAPAGDAPAATE